MEEFSPGSVAVFCGFLGGILLGFAARWGRFCTLGAIEDATFGVGFGRLRMWALALAVAIAGTHLLGLSGLVDTSQSFYLASPTNLVANGVGGLAFGLGMAFVGTCGYGTLARIGGGDLKSIVTFLVMGITAFATLAGVFADIRLALFTPPEAPDMPASLSAHLGEWAAVEPGYIGLGVAAAIAALALFRSSILTDFRKLATGVLVGSLIVWGWFATGVLAGDEFDAYPLESYTFAAPLGHTIMYAMTAAQSSLKFGIGATLGVVTGAAITSLAQGYFRWEASDDSREMRRQILGGVLMGFGGVTALGCTVGQGLSAASLLAFSAPVTLAGIFIGAWLGLQWLVSGYPIPFFVKKIIPFGRG